jgi:hypothetical protein
MRKVAEFADEPRLLVGISIEVLNIDNPPTDAGMLTRTDGNSPVQILDVGPGIDPRDATLTRDLRLSKLSRRSIAAVA